MMAPRKEEPPSAEIASPSGWKAKLSGIDTPHIVIGMLIIACTVIILWQLEMQHRSHERDTARSMEAHKVTQSLLTGVNRNQTLIIDAVQNSFKVTEEASHKIVYVLTRNPKEIEQLRLGLTMPESLRKQLNHIR